MLREDYRIVGSLVGSLVCQPHQNSVFGLPLQLLEDEAALLVEKGIAQIVELPVSCQDKESREKCFLEMREKNFQEQVSLFKEERQEEIKKMSKTIIEGKRKKLLRKIQQNKTTKKAVTENASVETSNKSKDEIQTGIEDISDSSRLTVQEIDDESRKPSSSKNPKQQETNNDSSIVDDIPEINEEEILKEEFNKIKPIPQSLSLVQLFTASPWTKTDELTKVQWNYPETEMEKLRYRIFKDFWERGYFLTSGLKFGGDFLVYPGDPLRFHSFYIAVVLPYTERFGVCDLILKGRLGTNVRKSVVICTVNENNDIIHTTLKWNNMT